MVHTSQEFKNKGENSKIHKEVEVLARPKDITNYAWYPDSGVTNHITSNLQHLSLGNKEYKGTQSIFMGNGKSISISHIGNASIKDKRELHLNNLLCMPQIKKNLMNVSQFANDNHAYFEFYPRFYVVRDLLSKDILLQGKVHNSLYMSSLLKNTKGCC